MEESMIATLLLMFFGALACGVLPFFLRVKETHLQTLSALGAGLMIGSALAVIIPEGFHGFAQAASHGHDHDHHEHKGHAHDHEHEGGLPEGMAGLVLVIGFLAMLLLDHLQHAFGGSCGAPGHSHAHGTSHSHAHGTSCSTGQETQRGRSPSPRAKGGKKAAVADDSSAAKAAPAPGSEAAAAVQVTDCTGKAKKGMPAPSPASTPDPQSAITGLVIHCAADGLAMGAAFLSGDARLSMLIAAAMVLHKAPMAFGLATYLMACQWSFQRSRRTLLLFAATAPTATLATYATLGSLAVLSSPAAVALCVIFSGGTFLYAATMHILPEVLHSGGGGRMSVAQLSAVTLGSLLPVLLSWGHHH